MKLNILVAYPYFKQNVFDFLSRQDRDGYRLIVDSGAFTAWNIGKVIKLDDYCRFLDSLESLRPFHAVQLDVFGNPEGTYKNLLTMRERGYDVMPVFTRGDTVQRLDEFYTMTDYIMFGGVVFGEGNDRYVKWFCEQNGIRKAHWLGFVDADFIKRYKPESVDSSSWQAAGRFGNLPVYTGAGKLRNLARKAFATGVPTILKNNAWRLKLSQEELRNLQHSDSWVGTAGGQVPSFTSPSKGLAYFVGACSNVLRAHEIEKKRRDKGLFVLLSCNSNRNAFCRSSPPVNEVKLCVTCLASS